MPFSESVYNHEVIRSIYTIAIVYILFPVIYPGMSTLLNILECTFKINNNYYNMRNKHEWINKVPL